MPKPSEFTRPRPLTLAVGLATLIITAALSLSGEARAEQQPTSNGQASSEKIKKFDIPAAPLSQVLSQFAGAANVALSFDARQFKNLNSPGLQGSYTVEAGFANLLAGTGATAVRQANGDYVLQRARATTLPPVKVSATSVGPTDTGTAADGYRIQSTNVGVLGDRSLQDTPYSVEVYSRDLMDNLQARSISDVTKLDASVSLSSGDLVAENNTIAIRGVAPDFDTGQKLDGMNLRSRATDLPLEHIESVDILKGAGGFLYGFGAPGGIINYTLKRPTDAPLRTVNLQVMDNGLSLVHGDFGGRLGQEDQFGYRVNAVHESGDTYINDGESRRDSASIALDWQLTPDVAWRVDALKASHTRYGGQWAVVPNSDGQASNFSPAKPPDPIDGDKRLAPEWASYGSVHETWGTDLNWQFADYWSLELAHRQSDSYRIFHLPGIFANVADDYSAYLYNYNNHFESEQSQLMLTGELTTGFILHNLVIGASHTETVSSNSGPLNRFVGLGSGNLDNPEEFLRPFGRLSRGDADILEYSRIKRREWFLSDTLHIGTQWDLIIGLRHGNLKEEYGDYDESEITPTLAIVHRPVDWVSLYASYVEALEQGAIAPETAANGGTVFEPLVSEQYEVGIKMNAERWTANASLFQLRRGLTYTGPDNVFKQDGEARFEGLEVSTKARIGDRWLLAASALWLDALNKKTADANLEGEKIQGVAREQFRLYGEFSVPKLPLVLSAGAQYVGKRPIDPIGQWHVDSITLFDLGARYEATFIGRPVTLRLNIDNITNESYWLTSTGSTSLAQGAPRTLKLGVEIAL